MLMVIPKKIKRFCLQSTRKGKVDRLEELTESLTSNTSLVAKKFDELKVVESDVKDNLKKLKAETFKKEIEEIRTLNELKDEERNMFIQALMDIKKHGIDELGPIAKTAQNIKGHMMVTLNKANIMRLVLISKSKLASNANLQLETLHAIQDQTQNINIELEDLLSELNKLNSEALATVSDIKHTVHGVEEGDTNLIDHIVSKYTDSSKKQPIKKEPVKV